MYRSTILNVLFNITHPYPHRQNQRRLTFSTPLRPKPNQHPPSSPRATRLQAHSAFLLLRFFLNTPLSGRPTEDFTSHVPFDRSHVIGPLHVALKRPLSQISCPSPRPSPLILPASINIFHPRFWQRYFDPTCYSEMRRLVEESGYATQYKDDVRI